MSPESRRIKSSMSADIIDRFFTDLFQCGLAAREVTVLWHSGEPLVLPPSYYDDAIARILRLKDAFASHDISIKFGIQTNGVLINDAWCNFFVRHASHLEVGVSCDGPDDLHDMFRVNWNGRSTHAQTIRGMDPLNSNGIKYKLIAVVNRQTLREPERFYRFFFERREQLSGFHFNILADSNSSHPDLSYSKDDRTMYYSFYSRLLEICRTSIEPFEILNFTQGAARILAPKKEPGHSFFEQATAPFGALNVDTSGNITTFYAGLSVDTLRDLYGDGLGLSLGNIFDIPLTEMTKSKKLKRMMKDFDLSKRACQKSCEYFSVCPGGFDILKKQALGSFESSETVECVIHVKALVDALLDDIQNHVTRTSGSLASA
ncbi:MAG: hypothetical protein H7Y42_04500 [Chitinophagaceae bacterium]|nr:hypothetical protein [Chitinophagaceae bacterium]